MVNETVKNPTEPAPSPVAEPAAVSDNRFDWVGKGSIQSPLKVLLLRHPKEKKSPLGTATLIEHTLTNVTLKTGLSWRNLKHASGDQTAENRRWAVLFLGTKKNFVMPEDQALGLFDPKGNELVVSQTQLDGIIALDGTWRDVKGMWWKNAWLLKLNQIQLNPKKPSQYGELRRAPRKENLSTLEAVGMTLSGITAQPSIEDQTSELMQKFLNGKYLGI